MSVTSFVLASKTETSAGSEILSLLRISEFFRFILQTFGRLSESFGKMGQIELN